TGRALVALDCFVACAPRNDNCAWARALRALSPPYGSLLLFQRQSAHHGGAAEFLPHAVDRALRERFAPSGLVEQVARISLLGLDDVGDADADQAIARAVGLAREQLAPGSKYFLRELGRVAEPARAGADLELVALELECDRPARQA